MQNAIGRQLNAIFTAQIGRKTAAQPPGKQTLYSVNRLAQARVSRVK
jgi:hypothetical protein